MGHNDYDVTANVYTHVNNDLKIAAASLQNIAYLTPFLSLIISAVILKEQISLRAIIALVFIVGGILLQGFCDSIKLKKSLSNK